MKPETVECIHGPSCAADHHGWDCPLADPLGDCLLILADPHPNPILDSARRTMLRAFGVGVL